MKYSSDAGGIPAVRRRRGRAAVLFGALGAATYIAALQVYPAPAQTTARRPASQEAGYAAPETCAVCHRKIWETYRRTGMGRSFYRPSAANTVGNDTPRHLLPQAVGQLLHDAPAGRQVLPAAPPDRRRRPADQRDGEADRLRDGVRQPRARVPAPDGRGTRWSNCRSAGTPKRAATWAMNPGYDRPDHEGFRRKITYDCMFCHNGYPKIPAGHDRPFAESVYEDPLPEGIDCQRCHGPGRKHAQLAGTAGARPDDIRKAIVNPSRLSPELREEVCIQCHLETTSFPLPNAIQRYERGPFEYRPGEPLSAYWLFFDHAPGTGHEDKFELVNAVYRIRRSKCFLQSNGALAVHDVPQSARRSARRGSNAALRRSMPQVPRCRLRWNRGGGEAPARGRLRRLPYAETAHRGRGALDGDRPLHTAAQAGGRSAGGNAGAARDRRQGLSRRGGAVLSREAAAGARQRSLSRPRAGGGEEQSEPRDRPSHGSDRTASYRSERSFTWDWPRRGETAGNWIRPCRCTGRRSGGTRSPRSACRNSDRPSDAPASMRRPPTSCNGLPPWTPRTHRPGTNWV